MTLLHWNQHRNYRVTIPSLYWWTNCVNIGETPAVISENLTQKISPPPVNAHMCYVSSHSHKTLLSQYTHVRIILWDHVLFQTAVYKRLQQTCVHYVTDDIFELDIISWWSIFKLYNLNTYWTYDRTSHCLLLQLKKHIENSSSIITYSTFSPKRS